MSVVFPVELYKQLKAISDSQYTTFSGLIRRIASNYIKQHYRIKK